MANGKQWTRDELLGALNLYHKLNFGQFDARNRAIIDFAAKLCRTPGSVARKLSNLASLDPVLKLRGISGLKGANALDRNNWEEFRNQAGLPNPAMIEKSETLLHKLFAPEGIGGVEVIPSKGIIRRPPALGAPTETTVPQKRRLGQGYFHQIVLNNSDGACGVCGLNIRELLVASHVLPWASNPAARLNIRNGLCLSRLKNCPPLSVPQFACFTDSINLSEVGGLANRISLPFRCITSSPLFPSLVLNGSRKTISRQRKLDSLSALRSPNWSLSHLPENNSYEKIH